MGLLVSGAGGEATKTKCKKIDPEWAKDDIYGFVNVKIYEDTLEVYPHYIKGSQMYKPEHWKTKELPPVYRRSKD